MKEKKGVLIADDMEFTRGILKVLLQADYTVYEAANGADALSLLERHGEDMSCVLLDIRMPGVDGYEVMDCMRRKGYLDRIPVIALTAISDPKGHIRCYESGAVDIIEKPYNEDLLLYKVRWVIKRFRRYMQPESVPDATPPRMAEVPALPKPLQKVATYCRTHFGLDSDESVLSMVESFRRTFDVCAARLVGQVEEPDFAEVRSIGHDLTGFVAGSGETELADLAIAMRAAARACDAEATSAIIRCILSLHEECSA